MKKILKPFACDICGRPMILWDMTGDFRDSNRAPSYGPNTNPEIKKWCGGYCDGILIPLALEIDSLLRLANKAKRKGVKLLAREAARRLKKIHAEQSDTIKKLMDSQ